MKVLREIQFGLHKENTAETVVLLSKGEIDSKKVREALS